MIHSFEFAANLIQKTLKREYPQVRRAWIFGSFADNSQLAESDLDVLVEIDRKMGLQYISMIQDLEEAADMKVDILTIEQAQELEAKFGYSIIGKAITVYERSA